MSTQSLLYYGANAFSTVLVLTLDGLIKEKCAPTPKVDIGAYTIDTYDKLKMVGKSDLLS